MPETKVKGKEIHYKCEICGEWAKFLKYSIWVNKLMCHTCWDKGESKKGF